MPALTKLETAILKFVPLPPSWVTPKILVRLVFPDFRPSHDHHCKRRVAISRACRRLYFKNVIAFSPFAGGIQPWGKKKWYKIPNA